MRANPNEVEYKNFLLKVGNGELQTFDEYRETIRVPDRIVIPETSSIIDHVFGRQIYANDPSVYNKCILTPRNDAR